MGRIKSEKRSAFNCSALVHMVTVCTKEEEATFAFNASQEDINTNVITV